MKIQKCHRVFVILILGTVTQFSRGDDAIPAWTQKSTRTVDNGYIVYVGVGEDSSAERSRLKAEGQAIQDLANECSFAPKGARIEDSFDQVKQGVHKTYSKLAIEYSTCDEAKKIIDPGGVRAEASVPMTEELKRYQDLVDAPETTAVAANGAKPLDLPSVPPTGGNGGSTPPATTQVVVVDNGGYWFWRQQVAYQKEIVVLAPATVYVPSAPITQTYVNNVTPYTQKILAHETANPSLRTSPQTWSSLPNRPSVEKPQALRPANNSSVGKPLNPPKNPSNMNHNNYGRPGQSYQPGGGGQPYGRRRRRWD